MMVYNGENKMVETYVAFQDIGIEIDRPLEITHRDKDICNRCRELLLNIKFEDDWTKEVDKIIKDYNITYKQISAKELFEKTKNCKNMTLRM
jgi:hypothetical protein